MENNYIIVANCILLLGIAVASVKPETRLNKIINTIEIDTAIG